MRAKEFLEDQFGTNPKRPARTGSRPSRGHEPQPRYKQGISADKENQFHVKLDKLVHNTFGPSSDEAKEGILSPVMPSHPLNPLNPSSPTYVAKNRDNLDMDKVAARAKLMFKQGMNELQVKDALVKQGVAPRLADQAVQLGQMNEHKKGVKAMKYAKKPKAAVNPSDAFAKNKERAAAPKPAAKNPLAKVDKHLGEWGMCEHCGCEHELELDERGKASLKLCKSSTPDEDLGASNLASCKSQGLRARDGDKSHKLGKSAKSRVKVGGHKIKGKKYGGPLPDWS